MARRSIVWVKDDPFGAEFADVVFQRDRLTASGTAIGGSPSGYRLKYRLETGPRFITRRLTVAARGNRWRKRLDLRRLRSGRWTTDALVMGALDCDLGLSPLTNTMPVLRHGLLDGGGPVEFLMAWVSVPDLRVRASRQRYTFVRRDGEFSIVRYESLDGTFVAELTFDRDGLCVRYPGIGRRV